MFTSEEAVSSALKDKSSKQVKMEKYNKGQMEERKFPKSLSMPYGVSSGIKIKRCQNCNALFFTNDNEFTKCRRCKNNEQSYL